MILYLFLIDKNLTISYLKQLFLYESNLTDSLMLKKVNILEKVYGKKARKALRIKGNKKKRYEKLLGLLKKRLVAYTRKVIFKYFIFNK